MTTLSRRSTAILGATALGFGGAVVVATPAAADTIAPEPPCETFSELLDIGDGIEVGGTFEYNCTPQYGLGKVELQFEGDGIDLPDFVNDEEELVITQDSDLDAAAVAAYFPEGAFGPSGTDEAFTLLQRVDDASDPRVQRWLAGTTLPVAEFSLAADPELVAQCEPPYPVVFTATWTFEPTEVTFTIPTADGPLSSTVTVAPPPTRVVFAEEPSGEGQQGGIGPQFLCVVSGERIVSLASTDEPDLPPPGEGQGDEVPPIGDGPVLSVVPIETAFIGGSPFGFVSTTEFALAGTWVFGLEADDEVVDDGTEAESDEGASADGEQASLPPTGAASASAVGGLAGLLLAFGVAVVALARRRFGAIHSGR